MKKFSRILLLLIVAMAFIALPVLAESGLVQTHPNVFLDELPGEYDDEGNEINPPTYFSIVYGHLVEKEGVEWFGIEINYYGESKWGESNVLKTARKLARREGDEACSSNENGDFGIKFVDLNEGYYSARAFVFNGDSWADAEYGALVYFTIGDKYKTNFYIDYYFYDGMDYVRNEALTKTLNGSIGATVQAEALYYEGYEYNVDLGVASAEVKAGLRLSLFYDVADGYVTFNYNGGRDADMKTAQVSARATDESLTAIVPVRPGYIFAGWASDEAGENPVTDTTGHSVVYAKWTALSELSAYEMGGDPAWFTDDKGEPMFYLQGAGVGEWPVYENVLPNYQYLVPGENNFQIGGTAWTEDGQWTLFPIWQNPSHSTYVGSVIKVPNIAMDSLTSITIRYLPLTSGGALQTGTDASEYVYLNANKAVEGNTANAGIRLEKAGASFENAVVMTITKEQLLAIMPADDNATLHTLYLDGYNWKSVCLAIDSIRFNTTDEAFVNHYANDYTTYTVNEYYQNAEGGYDKVARTGSILKGLNHTLTVSPSTTVDTHTYYSAHEGNKLTALIADDNSTEFSIYYNCKLVDVTYDFNGGSMVDELGQTIYEKPTPGVLSMSELMDGTQIVNEGKVFMGWSDAKQTETLNVDADGKVGMQTKFYAVWYDLAWLEFDGLDDTLYGALTEGSIRNNDELNEYVAKYSETGIYVGAKQYPSATDNTYNHTVIRMPHVDISQLAAINIYYQPEYNQNTPFYMDVNGVMNDSSTSNKLVLPGLATGTALTKVTFTKEQIVSIANGATHIDTLNFAVISWVATAIYVDKIEVITADPAYPTIQCNVTYDFGEGTDALGKHSDSAQVQSGTPLMDGTTLVRDGYTFYGWTTNPNGATTFDEMVAAGDLADNGLVGYDTTYYAVWYGNDWLEFNDAATNALILGGAYISTITNTPIDTELTMAGGRMSETFKSSKNHIQILMPRIAISDIESIQYTAYAYGFAWSSPHVTSFANSAKKWMGVSINGLFTIDTDSTTNHGGDNDNAFWKESNGGVITDSTNAAEIATLLQGEYVTAGTTHLRFLDMATSSGGSDLKWMLDYIRITIKPEQVEYTTEYYFQQADGLYSIDGGMTTPGTGSDGATVNAYQPVLDGWVVDSDNAEGVLSGVLVDGETLTLKVYYNKVSAYATEYYLKDANGMATKVDEATTNLTAEAFTTVNADIKEFDGYVYDEDDAANIVSATVAYDGTTVLKVYYEIAKVHVTYKLNDGTEAVYQEADVVPGSAIDETVRPTRFGYVFMGWSADKSGSPVTNEAITADTTLYAAWYDLTALEMNQKLSTKVYPVDGKYYYEKVGGGASYYEGGDVNQLSDKRTISTTWTEDGKYIAFHTWQSPGHAQYAGVKLRMPNLDMSALNSITIRYIVMADGYAIKTNSSVYLNVNKAVEDNTADAGILLAGTNGSFEKAVELTITKEQLLAIMPETDNEVLHTLYIDGLGFTASHVAIDSIRINTTDSEIADFYANGFATYTKDYYLVDQYGAAVKNENASRTATALLGAAIDLTTDTFAGYTLDIDNANNALTGTVTADGALALTAYHDLKLFTVKYNLNDNGDSSQVVTANQYAGEALIDGTQFTREGYTFFGWSTNASVTAYADLVAARDLADNGTISADVTYYAVWYGNDWLEFSNADVNALLISRYGINSNLTVDDEASTDKMGVQVGANQNPTENSNCTSGIVLPHVEIANLKSIEIRYKNGDTNNSWPAIISINNLHKTNDEVNGIKYTVTTEWTTLTITGEQIMAKFAGVEYIDELTFSGIHWADRRVYIDYIRITEKQYATYTTEHYVEQADGSYAKREDLTATATAEVGTTVTGTPEAIEGYTYDANVDVAVNSDVVAADGTTTLKLYYVLPGVRVTYDFNGGTNADGESSVTYRFDDPTSEALMSGDGITKANSVFMGWSATQQTNENVFLDVDADGLIGSDTTFYAVWYDYDWLNFDNTAANNVVMQAGANRSSDASMASVDIASGSEDGKGVQIRLWQSGGHDTYTYGILNLPHVAMDNLFSIEIAYTDGNSAANNNYSIAVNNKPTANGGTDQFQFAEPGEAIKHLTITKAQLAGITTDEFIDQLYFSGIGWQDRNFVIDYIKINTYDRYDLAWLSTDLEAGYNAGLFSYGHVDSNYSGYAQYDADNNRIKLRTNHPTQGAKNSYGIIYLPKLDMEHLVSITMNITAGSSVQYSVFTNEPCHVQAPNATLAVTTTTVSSGTSYDIVMTKEALANITTTGDTLHTLYISQYNSWNDSYVWLNSITIVTTQPGIGTTTTTVAVNG